MSQAVETIKVRETEPRKNWANGRMLEWVDERTRLYTGFSVRVAGRKWYEIIVHHDGVKTVAYVTLDGFDLSHHGPALHEHYGETACYRRVLREWFRDYCNTEVVFV